MTYYTILMHLYLVCFYTRFILISVLDLIEFQFYLIDLSILVIDNDNEC